MDILEGCTPESLRHATCPFCKEVILYGLDEDNIATSLIGGCSHVQYVQYNKDNTVSHVIFVTPCERRIETTKGYPTKNG